MPRFQVVYFTERQNSTKTQDAQRRVMQSVPSTAAEGSLSVCGTVHSVGNVSHPNQKLSCWGFSKIPLKERLDAEHTQRVLKKSVMCLCTNCTFLCQFIHGTKVFFLE